MVRFEKMGIDAALAAALIYIAGFIYFGAFWQYPEGADSVTQLAYLAEHRISFHIINLVIYVLFGVYLAVLVLALYEKMQDKHSALVKIATVFGFLWVGLVIASGMIITVGLSGVLEIATNDPKHALMVWETLRLVGDGLGGGNEVVGGLWVLLISLAALQQGVLSKGVNYLGLIVGAAGVLSLIPLELFAAVYGLSQIVWFLCLTGCLYRLRSR